jgi:ribonuclease HII
MELTDRQLPFELKIYMDEAGRWPLAGPVSVGTVIQTSVDLDKSQFADSKKLSPKKREAVYETMCSDARRDVGLPRPHTDCLPHLQSWSLLPHPPSLLFSVGFASAHEIDEYGIIWSLQIASVRSLFQTMYSFYENILRSKLEESVWGEDHIFQIVMDNQLIVGMCGNASTTWSWFPTSSQWQYENTMTDEEQLQFLRLFFHTSQRQFAYKGLYIDGNHTFGLDTLLDLKVQTIIKGDARNPMIGAASIAAKVERDSYMKHIDSDYPGWWFAKHKGYGTKTHRDVILEKFHTLSSRSLDHGRGKPTSLHSGWQQWLTPEHRITFLSRICSGESHK